MRWGARTVAGLLATSGLGFLSSCGNGDGYRPWWDQDKSAVVTVPYPAGDAGPSHDAGAGNGTQDAAVPPAEAGSPPGPAIQTVFFVLMAQQPWSGIAGNPSAPYINGKLLSMGAHSEAYFAAPPQIAQSEPNVVWLEAGQDFGIVNDNPPSTNNTKSTEHLVDQLEAAGVTWKAYVDGITTGRCPIVDQYPYRTFHVPFLFFDDVVGTPPSPFAKRCIEHVVPYTQLAADIAAHAVPRYAFIVPDFCDDMHDSCNSAGDPVAQGDSWLAANVPPILASKAYADNGAVFIAWDYADSGYVPLGFIALSAKARAGFAGKATRTTSSTLRSLQEIFGVTPLLGDAANATDLAELFESFP